MSTRNETNSSSPTIQSTPAAMESVVSAAEITAALGEDATASPLKAMLAQARRASYDQQEVVYQQGSANHTVIFVTEGLLKLVVHLPTGRARIVRLHRAGSVLGLSGLLGQDTEHMAVAVTPVTVLRLPIEALQRLRTDEPTTYVRLLERWHSYLRDADTWITEFSTGPIRGRVARLLTFLSDFEPDIGDDQVQLLTCEEMGSILGVTPESVSRILAEFKRGDIISPEQSEANDLYQADLDQLRDIAEDEE